MWNVIRASTLLLLAGKPWDEPKVSPGLSNAESAFTYCQRATEATARDTAEFNAGQYFAQRRSAVKADPAILGYAGKTEEGRKVSEWFATCDAKLWPITSKAFTKLSAVKNALEDAAKWCHADQKPVDYQRQLADYNRGGARGSGLARDLEVNLVECRKAQKDILGLGPTPELTKAALKDSLEYLAEADRNLVDGIALAKGGASKDAEANKKRAEIENAQAAKADAEHKAYMKVFLPLLKGDRLRIYSRYSRLPNIPGGDLDPKGAANAPEWIYREQRGAVFCDVYYTFKGTTLKRTEPHCGL